MASETPPFWWQKPGLFSAFLWPASLAYGSYARRRYRLEGRDVVDVPILCVATLAIGATGRSPVAIALARHASALGLRPGIVSRGPAGSHGEAHLVDLHHDSVRHVGEEALELAQHAPVAVASRRAVGARKLAGEGCDLIIVMDGFAGARIVIDYVLVVLDSVRGLGNGRVVPAGPVHAPLVDQLRNASGALLLGDGPGADAVVRRVARAARPVFQATYRTRVTDDMAGRRFMAFSSIGAPAQFHRLIRETGGDVVRSRGFSPGHQYSEEEARDIVALAKAEGLELITTVRDAVSLASAPEAIRQMLGHADVLEIDVVFETPDAPERIIFETLSAWQRRHAR